MCVCVSVDYSHATGYDVAYEHNQEIQCYKRLKSTMAGFLFKKHGSIADHATWANPVFHVCIICLP